MEYIGDVWIARPRTVAIFGGTFDPPTIAHQQIAISLLDHVDEVWVMPVYKHEIKRYIFGKSKSIYQSENSTFEDRATLCDATFNGYSNIKVMLTERFYSTIDEEYNGSTHTLLSYLRSVYKNYRFVLAIGEDNARTIDKWKSSDYLTASTDFIIYKREHSSNPLPDMLDGSKVVTIDGCSAISSTKARKILDTLYHNDYKGEYEEKQGLIDSLKELVPEEILPYILRNIGYDGK